MTEAGQYGDGAVDPGGKGGAERERRRHRPAIPVDEIGAPGGQRRHQSRQPPRLWPNIGVEQHDMRVLGLELRQRGEKVGAFLAAQRRQTGDDELDFELRITFGESCDAWVNWVFAGLDRNDQAARPERLGS